MTIYIFIILSLKNLEGVINKYRKLANNSIISEYVEIVNDDINDGTPYELETLMYGVKRGKTWR